MKYKKSFSFILIIIFLIINITPIFAINTDDDEFIKLDMEAAQEEDGEANWAEKTLSKIVRGFALAGEWMLEKSGITIESTVFNDNTGLEDGKENHLIFSFDDETTFGQVALELYSVFSKIALVFMVCILTFLGIQVWIKPSLSVNMAWKDRLFTYTISMLLIFLMPQIVKIGHNFFTELARAFKTVDGLTFVETVKYAAYENDNKKLTTAFLYAGGIGIQAWYGIIYAYRNIMLIFLFMFFPWFALMLNSETFKKGYETWFMEMFSILSIPLIDATLLYVISKVVNLDTPPFLSLILAGAIIPVRGRLRSIIGLSSGGASEMMGFAALAGVTGLVSKSVRGVKKGTSNIAEGYGDLSESMGFGSSMGEGMGGSSNSFGAEVLSNKPSMSGAMVPYSVQDMTGFTSVPATSTSYASYSNDAPQEVSKNTYAREREIKRLQRQGMGKILKGIGGMAGGGAAGLGMMGLTSMQGAAVMSYSAQIGGVLGDAIGENLQMGKGLAQKTYGAEGSQRATIGDVTWEAPKNEEPSIANGKILNDDVQYEDSNYASLNQPIFQAQGLPHGVGVNSRGEYTYDNVNTDIDKHLNDETKENLRQQAYNSAKQQTGIDPIQYQEQIAIEANDYFNKEIQSISDSGEPITIEVETQVRNDAINHVNMRFKPTETIANFNSFARVNYEDLCLDHAYNDLVSSGYSKSSLDQYGESIKLELQHLIEQQVQEMNTVDDISVEDII